MSTEANKNRVIDEINSLTVVRHANTLKARGGQSDAKRALSVDGLLQSVVLRDAMLSADIADWDVVLSSPLIRAMHTTLIVAGNIPETMEFFGISTDPNLPLNIMFKEQGYVPLIGTPDRPGYFNHYLGEHVKKWGREGLKVLLARSMQEENCANILVGGHAVCSSVLVWALFEALGYEAPECVTHVCLGEAQAIHVEIDTLGVPTATLISPQVPEPDPDVIGGLAKRYAEAA